jgi:glycoside/pentoside/hexuronide:cation symporter, GPH family
MERLLPTSSKLGFGVGQIAEGVKASLFNFFLLFYYNQIMGVPATLTAIILGIAVLFDGIADPIIGYLSDRTRTRLGRRHPWIIASAVPTGASLVMLFCPPVGMSPNFYALWLLGSAISLHLFLAMYHIPHLALGAEMASDYTDRTRIYAYSTVLGALGGWGFYFLAMSLFFLSTPQYSHGLYNPHGYTSLSILAAIVVIVSVALCVWGTWKEIPRLVASRAHKSIPTAHSLKSMFRELSSVFRNQSFRAIFLGSLLIMLMFSMRFIFNVYMAVHFWELSSERLRWIALAVIVGLPVAFWLAPLLTRLLDKRNALLAALLVTIVNDNILIFLRLFTNVLPANNDPLLFVMILGCFFMGGATAYIIAITIQSMLADVADQHDLMTGKRQEGAIFSVRMFSLKAASALGGALGGIALDLIAFPVKAKSGEVSKDIIFKLGLLDGPINATFVFIGLLLLFGYKLNRQQVVKIKISINERNALDNFKK